MESSVPSIAALYRVCWYACLSYNRLDQGFHRSGTSEGVRGSLVTGVHACVAPGFTASKDTSAGVQRSSSINLSVAAGSAAAATQARHASSTASGKEARKAAGVQKQAAKQVQRTAAKQQHAEEKKQRKAAQQHAKQQRTKEKKQQKAAQQQAKQTQPEKKSILVCSRSVQALSPLDEDQTYLSPPSPAVFSFARCCNTARTLRFQERLRFAKVNCLHSGKGIDGNAHVQGKLMSGLTCCYRTKAGSTLP